MGKKRVCLLAVVLLAIADGLVWEVSRSREPMYEGEPLSFWLKGYAPYTVTETSQQQADNAMRAIGTNAIPTLLHMLQAKDSALKVKLNGLLDKQHVIKAKWGGAEDKIWEAMQGFEALHGDAKQAVPALIDIYERNISGQSRFAAIHSLGAIGAPAKSAVPILASSLADPKDFLRNSIITALGEIHSNPDTAIPILIQCLGDTSSYNRLTAARALGNFGAEARGAVPALLKLLQDNDPEVRTYSFQALKQIDPETADKFQPTTPPN